VSQAVLLAAELAFSLHGVVHRALEFGLWRDNPHWYLPGMVVLVLAVIAGTTSWFAAVVRSAPPEAHRRPRPAVPATVAAPRRRAGSVQFVIELLVPFYGPGEQLFDLVHSVLAQTSPRWRLIVVDDAWPGDPVAPGLMALGNDRIRYRRNPDNLGVNGNFQRCLDLAEEERVVFLGGDDLLLPSYVGRLETMHALFPDASVIQPGGRGDRRRRHGGETVGRPREATPRPARR
jgi:hypothetical protein